MGFTVSAGRGAQVRCSPAVLRSSCLRLCQTTNDPHLNHVKGEKKNLPFGINHEYYFPVPTVSPWCLCSHNPHNAESAAITGRLSHLLKKRSRLRERRDFGSFLPNPCAQHSKRFPLHPDLTTGINQFSSTKCHNIYIPRSDST